MLLTSQQNCTLMLLRRLYKIFRGTKTKKSLCPYLQKNNKKDM